MTMTNRRLSMGIARGAGAWAVTAMAAATAIAAPAPDADGELAQRVAIDSFRGPQGAVVQDAVESALLRRYFLVPDAQVTEAARKSGVRLRSDEDFAEVGKSLNVAAFVTATVKRNKNWRVEMVVRDGETGEAVARYDVTDRRLEGLAAALARATPRRLQVLLASHTDGDADEEALLRAKVRPAARPGARPPGDADEDAERNAQVRRRARPTDGKARDGKAGKGGQDKGDGKDAKDAKDDEDADETAADDQPARGRGDAIPRPYLELGGGGRVFSRSMTFTDNVSNIPAYRLDRATAITIDMALHPFAMMESTRDDWIAGFGLTGNVTYAMGVTTEQAGTQGRARTEVHGYELGLRYRAALGPVDVTPRLGFIAETFAANVGTVSPDVDYRVVRAGLGTQVFLSRQAFMRANIDYLDVLSAGRLNDADRFPRAITRGVDVGMGAGYAFGDSIEAWVAVGLRRYGYDLKVKPGDTLIAGGALDEYVSMSMGLTYRPTMATGRK